MPPAKTTTETLNETLIAARRAYYDGNPIMTDAEYDMAEQQLQANVKLHPEEAAKATVLTTVGDVANTGGRLTHDHPMRSIQNVYSVEELATWLLSTLEPGDTATIDSKWDGVSCSLTYEDKQLIKAVTRGDGEAGENILPQVLAMRKVPKTIPLAIKIEVRGELVMRRSSMDKLNTILLAADKKPYMSPRNLVAGTIKLRDLEEVARRDIEFMPWEVLCPLLDAQGKDDPHSDSAIARLTDLVDMGFAPPDGGIFTSIADIKAAVTKLAPLLAEKDPELGRDGLVIKVNSCSRRRELGVGSKFANFQVAYKIQNARAESRLINVTWQVGRQGKLTPVAEIEPVILAGAEVRRATLNNMSWITEMGLKLGSRVMVVRSGDVIPQIVEVLDV